MILDLPDGTELDVPDTITPAQKSMLQQKLREKFSITTTPTTEGSALERGAGYLAQRGKQWLGAVSRLGQIGEPLEMAQDWATAAAPLLAPELTAAGIVTGTAARTAGASPGTAEAVEAGTNVLGGLGGAVRGAIRGGKAAADIVEEGRTLRGMVPGMRQTVSGARKALFDPIVEGLQQTGKTLKSWTPEGQRFIQGLEGAAEDWGSNRAIRTMLDQMKYGGIVEPGQLDQALAMANQMPKSFATRRVLTEGLADLARGTPFEGKLTAAGRQYFQVLKPAQAMAKAVGGQDTPAGAAKAAMRVWQNLGPESQRVIDPTGDIAAVIKSATQSHRGALAMAGLAGVPATYYATRRFLEGDIRGGLEALLLGGGAAATLRYPGIAGAALRGAAGPAGRAALAVAGGPGARDLVSRETPSEVPGAPETPPEAPGEEAGPSVAQAPPRGPKTGTPGGVLNAVANGVGIPAPFLNSVMQLESSGVPTKRGAAGEVGLMQIMPDTWKQLEPRVSAFLGRPANLYNPLDNLVGGAMYLREHLDATNGDVREAARRYNGGPGVQPGNAHANWYGDTIVRNFLKATQ